jgi:hypothetical protein
MSAPTRVQIADKPGDVCTYRIADVAQMTHISQRRILDACRAKKIAHIHAGGRRLMTQSQIEAMLTFFTAAASQVPVSADPREQVRQSSLRAAARQTPRRAR